MLTISNGYIYKAYSIKRNNNLELIKMGIKKLQETLSILYLIGRNIKDNISVLEEISFKPAQRLSFKCLYIDIHSFMDEMEELYQILHLDDNIDIKIIDHFLLVSFNTKKFINKHKESLGTFRNTIYAHNYRNKKKIFVEPNKKILQEFEKSPVLLNEMLSIAEACLLLEKLAHNCFKRDDRIAFNNLEKAKREFDEQLPQILQKKQTWHYKELITSLQKEVYEIEDSLKSNYENYKLIALKLKCNLKSH